MEEKSSLIGYEVVETKLQLGVKKWRRRYRKMGKILFDHSSITVNG